MVRFNPFRKDPNAQPPSEVRILELKVEPWEGSKRYKVMVRLTPFQKPPNLNFKLLGQAGDSLGELAIIENIDTDLIVTLHQRKPDSVAAKVEVDVFYDADGIVDSQTCTVD